MTNNRKAEEACIKSRVYVLYTGGTFGMHKDKGQPGAPLAPMSFSQLKAHLPPASLFVEQTEVTLDVLPGDARMDSSSMTPSDWVTIARQIEKNYADYDAFIVIHGTDTLAYTASALSFMFENLAKPVIVTGSQLPLLEARTDAKLNYGHALQIAAWRACDLPLIPEVIIVFGDRVLRGCRARKISARAWAGFDTPNCPILGEIGEHTRIFETQILPSPAPGQDFALHADLAGEVVDVNLYPGLRAVDLERMLASDDIRGAVLRTYGIGNAPEDPKLLAVLHRAVQDEGKVIVNITQCPHGMVEMGRYASSVGLVDAGVISGFDMTPEAALTKMMVTMGQHTGADVGRKMQINQRGEQSQNRFELVFQGSGDLSEFTAEMTRCGVPLDTRFCAKDLSSAVLRLDGLRAQNAGQGGTIDVCLVHPEFSKSDDQDYPNPERLLCLSLDQQAETILTEGVQIIENLAKDPLRALGSAKEVTLALIPSEGVRYQFKRLTLSLFTQAR